MPSTRIPKPKTARSAMFIGNPEPEIQARFTRAARARNMTSAQYLAALVNWHDAGRALADAGDERVQAELTTLGLQTVAVSFTA